MFLVTYLIDLYVNMYDVKTYTVPYTVPLERRYLTYIRQKLTCTCIHIDLIKSTSGKRTYTPI